MVGGNVTLYGPCGCGAVGWGIAGSCSNTAWYPAGPTHWGTMFQKCAGNRQSPINIETGNVKTEYWKPLKFKNYNEPPTLMRIKNNGHSG